jgi:DNA-binding MarR family transcriptional regulator
MVSMVSRQPAASDAQVERAHAAIAVLGRLSEAFRSRREQLASAVGLSDQQWEVLERIAAERFMPSLFAAERASSAAAVSKIIRQLVDKGLVLVSVAAGDARHRDYRLTPQGGRVVARLRRERERAIERVWLSLDADVLEDFTRVGDEIATRLAHYEESRRKGASGGPHAKDAL